MDVWGARAPPDSGPSRRGRPPLVLPLLVLLLGAPGAEATTVGSYTQETAYTPGCAIEPDRSARASAAANIAATSGRDEARQSCVTSEEHVSAFLARKPSMVYVTCPARVGVGVLGHKGGRAGASGLSPQGRGARASQPRRRMTICKIR